MFGHTEVVTKSQRLDQTLVTLYYAGFPLGVRAIAERQGLKVTPYIRYIIQQLVYDGLISFELIEANGYNVYVYRLTEEGLRSALAVVETRG